MIFKILKGILFWKGSLLKVISASGLGLLFIVAFLWAIRSFWKKQNKLGLASMIFGVLMLVPFLFIRTCLKKEMPRPLSSTVMFKKLEYVEHLKLVSFYSEQVVVVGTKEKVQRIVDDLKLELKELAAESSKYDHLIASQDTLINKRLAEFPKLEDKISLLKESRGRIRKLLKEIKKQTIKTKYVIEPMLLKKDTLLKSLCDDYNVLIQLESETKDSLSVDKTWKDKGKRAASRNKKEERSRLRGSLKRLRIQLKDAKGLLESRLELLVEREEQELISGIKIAEGLQKEVVQNIKLLNKKRDKFNKKRKRVNDDLFDVTIKLEEAGLELEYAKSTGEDIEPELLILIPTEISVYLDMAKIWVDTESDSLVILQLPNLEFNPVGVSLRDSSAYSLDKSKAELEGSREGAYYDFFEQLKLGIENAKTEAMAKAIDNDIITEGRDIAERYLINFITPLGYDIQFEWPALPISAEPTKPTTH